jgi:hypothetical protein
VVVVSPSGISLFLSLSLSVPISLGARLDWTDLKSSLVLLGVLAMDLLHGAHVILEIDDGVLPCLQALSQKASGLDSPKLAIRSLLIGYETLVPLDQLLTLDGSKSGTASSLMRLMLVAARDGMSTVVGEAAEDILARGIRDTEGSRVG